jgi:4-alpha-glucanotransferase
MSIGLKLPPVLGERTSGVLLHLTSLPGPWGSGDLGAPAVGFTEFLERAKQSWWQVLPLGPPGPTGSPYDGPSLFAGSPLLVALDRLAERGWVDAAALAADAAATNLEPAARIAEFRDRWLRRAFAAFERAADETTRNDLEAFCVEQDAWLSDWTLFFALKKAMSGAPWTEWGRELCERDPSTIGRARMTLGAEIRFQRFVQWTFFRQLQALRAACAERGIGLVGDLPFYPAHDSADVWAHQDLFQLDEAGRPTAVAGVPPDYFTPHGQLWGNPVYRWDALRHQDYAWWLARLRHGLACFDALRLDHFVGFERVWTVPVGTATAAEGRYSDGPGRDFLMAVADALGKAPLIAEDLGAVTPAVEELRDAFDLPGMRVLQFSFAEGTHADRPYRFPKRSVVYTGTHDNDTCAGWLASGGKEPALASEYAGTGDATHWDLVRLAQMLPADTAIVPAQDLLGLPSEARMNAPGVPDGNWRWRLRDGQLDDAVAARLAHLTELYGRAR